MNAKLRKLRLVISLAEKTTRIDDAVRREKDEISHAQPYDFYDFPRKG